MQLAQDLAAAGVKVFPASSKKRPAVKGWQNPLAPERYTWPSEFFGVPTPRDIAFFDIDHYKAHAATLQEIDSYLGVALDWDAALLQTTQSGGAHYAFRCDYNVRQGANIGGLVGFDIRGPNANGYIISGPTYAPRGFGVWKLANPQGLPLLPAITKGRLEKVAVVLQNIELPADSQQVDKMRAALHHIDPSERDTWFKVGCAIHFEFNDQEQIGFTLFDEWSSGQYWDGEEPEGYAADTQEHQYFSMSPEGVTGQLVTSGTLYRLAGEGGWVPNTVIDSAEAFGHAIEAPQGLYESMVERILESGANEQLAPEILREIRLSEWSDEQRAILFMTYRRGLVEAGFDKKAVGALMGDGPTAKAPTPAGMYGTNDTDNAAMFLESHFPGGTFARCDGIHYIYNGKAWEEIEDDRLESIIAMAMAKSKPQHSKVKGCMSMLSALTPPLPVRMGAIDPDLVLFQNGVLRLSTGELTAHSPMLYTTNIKPYNYNPHAVCPNWLVFLNASLDGDQELIALMQEWLGYLMTRSYKHQKMLLMLGASRSGKGTIARILKLLIGVYDYFAGSLSSFANDSYINAIRDKPVVVVADAEKKIHAGLRDRVTERVKNITGLDEITFDRKYKSTLSETMPSRLTVISNSRPQLFDDSGALGGRIMIIPFNVSFMGREDLHLGDKLELEIEGIALWALQGMAKLNAQGRFTVPAASLDESEFLAEVSSPLKMFIDDVCVFGGETKITAGDLYESYCMWAIEGKHDAISQRAFSSSFSEYVRGKGPRRCRVDTGNGYLRGFSGVGLRAAVTSKVSPFDGPKPVAV